MNGKRAKAIARRTEELMLALGIKLGDGYGKYECVNNHITWVLAKDKDGKLLRDPEGGYLTKPVNSPGTITTRYKFRAFYQWLKKMYKKRDPEGMAIINATPEELYRLAKIMESRENK